MYVSQENTVPYVMILVLVLVECSSYPYSFVVMLKFMNDNNYSSLICELTLEENLTESVIDLGMIGKWKQDKNGDLVLKLITI